MKKIKEIFFILLVVVLMPSMSMAQSKVKDQKIVITGITGESIKEPLNLDESEKIVNKITKQIIKDNLIENEKELSFMLNNKEFIVNGVKQSTQIHTIYKEKYIKDKIKWNICKNYKM